MAALEGVYDNSPANTSGEICGGLSADVECYPGAGMVWNGGYLEPATQATGLTTAGALKSVKKITGGAADGDVKAVVETSIGPNGLRTYAYDNDSGGGAVAQANIPVTVYWLDDHTVTRTSTGASVAGTAVGLDSDGRVRIRFAQ